MKRKILVLSLLAMLLLTSCGSQELTTTPSAGKEESNSAIEESTAETTSSEETGELSELDALGSVEVEENLFSVELTIPADYVGETTQEELDTIASENGYKSIKLNADGSATYIMTKSQHKSMLEEMATSINGSLSEMIGSAEYPNITAIEANDNFSEFTITTKSVELDMNESFSILIYYMYGGMYAIFEGTEVDNISVTFINADSGEVISTSNSSDME